MTSDPSSPSPSSMHRPDAMEPSPVPQTSQALFAERPEEPPARPVVPWAVAALAVLVVVVILALAGRGHPAGPANVTLPADPYASSLVLSDLQMSESTSLSGGKSTFIDGRIRNAGSRTVTASTVQVRFANDEALPTQVETMPLTLIRAREPYIDIQPIGSAPMAPGDEREFRLIFENIGSNWNQNLPEIRIVRVATH